MNSKAVCCITPIDQFSNIFTNAIKMFLFKLRGEITTAIAIAYYLDNLLNTASVSSSVNGLMLREIPQNGDIYCTPEINWLYRYEFRHCMDASQVTTT